MKGQMEWWTPSKLKGVVLMLILAAVVLLRIVGLSTPTSLLLGSVGLALGLGVLDGLADSRSVEETRRRIDDLREQSSEPIPDQPDNELRDLESTVAFQAQAAQARSGSRWTLRFAVAIVSVAIIAGIFEIARGEDLNELSTGDGIFRASVVAAVFYLAGQMFRRATALERRADDLDRAVVALRYGEDLSQDVRNSDLRDRLIADIYLSHLGARTIPETEDRTLGDVASALLKRP